MNNGTFTDDLYDLLSKHGVNYDNMGSDDEIRIDESARTIERIINDIKGGNKHKWYFKCSVTGEGMNCGYRFADGTYVKYEKDADRIAVERGYSCLHHAIAEDECVQGHWHGDDGADKIRYTSDTYFGQATEIK